MAIEFAFYGTSLTLFLEDGHNLYNVTVDGHTETLETELGQESYVVANDLQPGRHHFRLVKRTEAYVGAAVFKGGRITGELLEPAAQEQPRSLEFIGDSITTGYGNEGESPECWFTPQTQNAALSYAALTADALQADYALVALSGLGVIRNLRAEEAASPETAIDFVERTLGLNPFITWPAGERVPDAVIINLGTNDYSSLPFPEEEAFIDAYLDLLERLRDRYPQASLFAVAGPLMSQPAPRVIETAVDRFRRASGDEDVYFQLVVDDLERSAKDFGCDWHPNENGHRKIAAQLIPPIAERLGW